MQKQIHWYAPNIDENLLSHIDDSYPFTIAYRFLYMKYQ